MTTTQQQDVVDLLIDQHNQIKTLFNRVRNTSGTERRDAFEDLVRLIAVHESAEEEVVHPSARKTIDHGDQIVQGRLNEENEAKHVLAELCDMGVEHPEFDTKFAAFTDAVIQHATHEETEEFPALRRDTGADRLVKMAGAVKTAEAVAPTRPHPNAGESSMANMVAGPPMAIFDRVRDRMREWRQSNP